MTNLSRYIMIRLLALPLLIVLGGCDSFVDVELPNSQLTGSTVFEDRATADAAMTAVYASIRDEGLFTGTMFGLSNCLGAYADELDFYGSTSMPTFYYYNNSLLSTNVQVQNLWSISYNQVYMCNAVIEGVEASTALAQSDRQRLKGEALFLRALVHFYLANVYGDIPYVTTTDYRVNALVTRLPIAEVYAHAIADLQDAYELLPADYSTSGRARANKWTAQGLLAKVFLYDGQWAEASNAASSVIGQNALYALESNIDAVFVKDSQETIWQLPPAIEGRNTNEAATFTLLSPPPSTVALTDELVAAFESGDLRAPAWVGEISNGSGTWYFASKYKQYNFQGASSEYSIMMRLAELYLIRAEARARQGELVGAQDDLNLIRQRAGLGNTTASTQDALLAAILSERRVELFTELGNRFFDLKRFGQIDTVLGAVKPGWDSTDRLFPIPQADLNSNPYLGGQNPGY